MKLKLLALAAVMAFTLSAFAVTMAGAVEFAEKKSDIIKILSKEQSKEQQPRALSKGLKIGKDRDISIRPEGENASDPGQTPSEPPRVAAMILFKYNSTAILPKSLSVLDEYGSALNDAQLKNCNICVEGHTDGDGSAEYNMELSNKRAQAVVDYLVKNCDVARERLSTRGWGKTKPIDSNATDEGKQKNRRVEFTRLN